MKRAILPGVRLALAVASGGAIAFPAYADMSLPPAQYDIGGETEDEVIEIAYAMDLRFPMIRVPYGGAKAECDRISYQRYGTPYPASVTPNGETLLGCMIQNVGLIKDPILVYTHSYRGTTAQLLRHEIAHWLGWAPDHGRD
jgi:hypothetical protein